METAHSIYLGELRTQATHQHSGTEIFTDAPLDNQGKAEFFSPTDLVATALGSCLITIIGIAARTHGFSIDGATWKTTKIMASDPRRISEIVINIEMPDFSYTEKQKQIIDFCIKNCPVAKSLHPDLKQTIHVEFKN